MIQFDNAVERYNTIILKELKEAGITCWIAGGALRDYFMGVAIKTDYDLFFPNQGEYDKAASYFKSKDAKVKWENENGMKVVHNRRTYDLIKKFFDSPQATIDRFDFTVCMLAVDTERLYHGATTFIDLAKRQLMFNTLMYPPSSLSRAFRYYNKGFNMCLGEMRKLIEAIQAMPKEPEQPQSERQDGNTNEEDKSSGDGFFRGID